VKALALISGGLDSLLAAKVMRDTGIDVIGLYFVTSFGTCHKKALQTEVTHAAKAAQSVGIPLEVIDITEDFFKILRKPKHGFGSQVNPCIDCKILMLAKARALLEKYQASFVVTGEVLGQRPMSQHRRALSIIEQESGLEGLMVRPLSARLLAETIPEKQGWISRERLLSISGRSRRPQIALAQALGIERYPNAAGGCLLTEEAFSRRFRDLLSHDECSLENTKLLTLGRHFRIGERTKLVVGRDQCESEALPGFLKQGDYLFMPPLDLAGPTALGRGVFDEGLIRLACSIVSRYCDRHGASEVSVVYQIKGCAATCQCVARAADDGQIHALRI